MKSREELISDIFRKKEAEVKALRWKLMVPALILLVVAVTANIVALYFWWNEVVTRLLELPRLNLWHFLGLVLLLAIPRMCITPIVKFFYPKVMKDYLKKKEALDLLPEIFDISAEIAHIQMPDAVRSAVLEHFGKR